MSAPTGAGKTYCFAFISQMLELKEEQERKRLRREEWEEQEETATGVKLITIVVSPLTSLMSEQSQTLKQMGINAEFVGELQNDPAAKRNVLQGSIEILFITPESLAESNWKQVISGFGGRVKCIVVDEAHCISHW